MASEHLNNLLFDRAGQYLSKEEDPIDEQIFYFVPPASFRLSDEKLRTKILAEI